LVPGISAIAPAQIVVRRQWSTILGSETHGTVNCRLDFRKNRRSNRLYDFAGGHPLLHIQKAVAGRNPLQGFSEERILRRLDPSRGETRYTQIELLLVVVLVLVLESASLVAP
jgi:hypothetical protein